MEDKKPLQNDIGPLSAIDWAMIWQERRKKLIQAGLLEPADDSLPALNPLSQPNNVQTTPIVRAQSKFRVASLGIWKFINNNIVSTVLGGGILAWLIWHITRK